MRHILRPLAIVLAASLVLLTGCRDKHEPVKPTVAATQPYDIGQGSLPCKAGPLRRGAVERANSLLQR